MRRSVLAMSLAAGVACAVPLSTSATAATSGDTPVTLEVVNGELSIEVPNGPVDLGSVPVSTSAQTVSAQLGNVVVTDGRGGTADWNVTAHGVDFTGPQNISVSAPGSSTYNAPAATTTGTVTVTSHDLSPIYPPGVVQAATGVSGINTATWNPTISIQVPANTLAGNYSSTITHSVS
jgi:hypothetical protein